MEIQSFPTLAPNDLTADLGGQPAEYFGIRKHTFRKPCENKDFLQRRTAAAPSRSPDALPPVAFVTVSGNPWKSLVKLTFPSIRRPFTSEHRPSCYISWLAVSWPFTWQETRKPLEKLIKPMVFTGGPPNPSLNDDPALFGIGNIKKRAFLELGRTGSQS